MLRWWKQVSLRPDQVIDTKNSLYLKDRDTNRKIYCNFWLQTSCIVIADNFLLFKWDSFIWIDLRTNKCNLCLMTSCNVILDNLLLFNSDSLFEQIFRVILYILNIFTVFSSEVSYILILLVIYCNYDPLIVLCVWRMYFFVFKYKRFCNFKEKNIWINLTIL